MKGCRPLSDAEAQAVYDVLGANHYAVRDRALFALGERTGFRISELLSLRVGDVWQNGRIPNEVAVARRNMKKKREGRKIDLHDKAKAAIQVWLDELFKAGFSDPQTFLFKSREGENRAITRYMAWTILKKAFNKCGLSGKLATHSLRKTFAKRMKEALGGDLQALQKAMGHAQITSTMSYLEVDEEKIRAAILKT